MELVIKDGKTFWLPAVSGDKLSICNFSKWEQAFRVYSNIYTQVHPDRAAELIEYNHIIHSIALSFVWDNVDLYGYDKDFRLHMSRHPDRSWAIILQQVWTMRLRDRLRHDNQGAGSSTSHFSGGGHGHYHNGHGNHSKGKSPDYCKRYNKGKCNLGRDCRYEHRCSYCYKFGHGVIVCRKLIFDRENNPKKDAKDGNTGGGASQAPLPQN